MNRVTYALVIFLTAAAGLPAQDAATPNPREILAKADEAASKLKAISYDGAFHGEGAAAERVPKVEGKVIAERGAASNRPRVRIEGTFAPSASAKGEPVRFATDGATASRIEDTPKKFMTGKAGDAVSPELNALLPPKYLVDTPFRQDQTISSISYVRSETVDGVECDVINVSYNPAAGMGMTYWFGQKDHLLRRLENTISLRQPGDPAPQKGKIIFSAKNLDAQPKIDSSTFTLTGPDGYARATFEPKPQVGATGLLAAGTPAPDWELKTLDGKPLSLKSLRGKVVILDFWASWCGPCKMAMPGLEKLHQRFKDKPVAIVGVNCREKSDPTEAAGRVVKDLGLNYTQVIGGDDVAKTYLVKGIPCFYVIDTEGKIVYATSGWQPQHDEMIAQFIEEILKTAGKQAAAAPAPKS